MKVCALVGKSGTGKSYQAMNICRDENITGIIDDGLFIIGKGIIAGTSAKRQTTKIGAVKTALFTQEEHRSAVSEKIREIAPDSLLVIGTSAGMARKIAERLQLPEIERVIDIESITTERERETAKKQRNDLGKHVIPVPTFQIKREFSGYFLDPLRIFRGRGKADKGSFAEKSVVRPTYSYMGDYLISDKVISDIIHCVAKSGGQFTVTRVVTEDSQDGILITVLVLAAYGCKIIKAAKGFQEQVAERVGHMTAFHVSRVNIEVRGLN